RFSPPFCADDVSVGTTTMNAVASLFDEEHDRRVRAICDELQQELGIRRVMDLVPWPHVTYQGAERYDHDRLDVALRGLADKTAPLSIQTTGLGIFTGPLPVLYLAVARTPQLSAFHTAVWQAIGDAGEDFSPYYTPNGVWTPHITLAQWDLTRENLPSIVGLLCERPLAWEIPITNLVLFTRDDDTYTLWRRYNFGA